MGAPGADDDQGTVYVYTAENMGKASTNVSRCRNADGDGGPSLYNGQRSRGDRFGCSVAMDEDDIVIGVCGAADRPRRRDATPERTADRPRVPLLFWQGTVRCVDGSSSSRISSDERGTGRSTGPSRRYR